MRGHGITIFKRRQYLGISPAAGCKSRKNPALILGTIFCCFYLQEDFQKFAKDFGLLPADFKGNLVFCIFLGNQRPQDENNVIVGAETVSIHVEYQLGLASTRCLKVYQTERATALQARGVDLKGLYCKGGGGRKEAKKLGMEEGRKSSHIKFSVTIFSPLPFINRHISALGGRI